MKFKTLFGSQVSKYHYGSWIVLCLITLTTGCQKFDFSKLIKKNAVMDYPSLDGPGSVGFAGDPSSGFQLGSVTRISGSGFSIPNSTAGGNVYDISAHVNSIFALNPSLVSAVAAPNNPARNIPVQFIAAQSGGSTITVKLGDLRETNGSRNAVIVWSMDGATYDHVIVPTIIDVYSYQTESIFISGQPNRFVIFGGTGSAGVYSRRLHFVTKIAATSLGTLASANLLEEGAASPPVINNPVFALAVTSFSQAALPISVPVNTPIFGRRTIQTSASYPANSVNAVYAFNPANAAQTVIAVPSVSALNNRTALLCAAGPGFFEGECIGSDIAGRLTAGTVSGTWPVQNVTLTGTTGYGISKITSIVTLSSTGQPANCIEVSGGTCAVGSQYDAGYSCSVQVTLNQQVVQSTGLCNPQPWRVRVSYQTLPYVDQTATDQLDILYYAPTTLSNAGVIGNWDSIVYPDNPRIPITATSAVTQGAIPAKIISIGTSSNTACFQLHTQVNNANCVNGFQPYPGNGCNINLKRMAQCACTGSLTYTWQSRIDTPVQSTTVQVSVPSNNPSCADAIPD